MGDLDTARLVAADLESYLRWRGPHLPGPVYALALWADADYGNFGISFGTEPDSGAAPAADPEGRRSSRSKGRFAGSLATSPTRGEPWGPASSRWNSGDWDHIVEEFVSSRTQQALAPLKAMVNDLDLDDATHCGAQHRWQEIGFKAVQLTRLPAELPTAADALFFAECGDDSVAQLAYWMLRNVDPDLFHRMFPHWRRLAVLARRAGADDALMARARQAAAEWKAVDVGSADPYNPLPAELTAALDACDLYWLDVAEWSERLRLALTVADATTHIGPAPCRYGYPYEGYMTSLGGE